MNKTEKKKAVVLLSGGLDSATCLAIAEAEGFECYALSFRYGQRHEREIEAAKKIALAAGVARHVVQNIDLAVFGGSSLTSAEPIPKDREIQGTDNEIPSTYVPARNTIFLSFALAFAETLSGSDIFIGVNAVDYSGYPDCRPEFIEAFETTARLATRMGVQDGRTFRVHAPLIRMSKAEIIRAGTELGVDYSLTHSCYDPTPEGLSCGRCDSCRLRLRGFAEAGIADPIAYVK